MIFRILITLFFASVFLSIDAQKYKKTKTIDDRFFGIQAKPMLPINYFGMRPTIIEDTLANIGIYNKPGYTFGMVMRRNFTDLLSFETGINYVRRNFLITATSTKLDTSDRSSFGTVGYEIPLQTLIYIRLSKELYMNVSTGFSINFNASDVQSVGINNIIQHVSTRYNWAYFSFLTNLGFEYRTKNKGGFYIGSSLLLPFKDLLETKVNYYYQNNQFKQYKSSLKGTYFTVDLRYFFANFKK